MKRRLFRNLAQKLYKSRKKQDREVGLEVNKLVQEIHYEIRQMKKEMKEGKVREDNKQYLQTIVDEIRKLKGIKLTKHEFGSFADFWKYLKKEKISYKDVKMMLER